MTPTPTKPSAEERARALSVEIKGEGFFPQPKTLETLTALIEKADLAAAMEEAVLRAVDEEPNLPGEPHAEMHNLLSTVEGAVRAMRAAVAVTKRNIRERIIATLSQTGGQK